MAKKVAKRPPPPPVDDDDDDVDEEEAEAADDAADEDDEAAEVEEELAEEEAAGEEGADEDAEYVPCPVCQGKGRGCRYCDGYGDVHPDDIPAILKAHKKAGGMPTAVIAIVVCLVLGVGGAVFMILRSSENQNGSSGTPGTPGAVQPGTQANGGTGSSSSGGGAPATPTLRKQEVTDAIIDMKMFMKMKRPEGYQKVIEIGTKALPLAEDPTQKQNVLDLMAQARSKLGQ